MGLSLTFLFALCAGPVTDATTPIDRSRPLASISPSGVIQILQSEEPPKRAITLRRHAITSQHAENVVSLLEANRSSTDAGFRNSVSAGSSARPQSALCQKVPDSCYAHPSCSATSAGGCEGHFRLSKYSQYVFGDFGSRACSLFNLALFVGIVLWIAPYFFGYARSAAVGILPPFTLVILLLGVTSVVWSMSVGHGFAQHFAGADANFDPVLPTTIIYMIKLLLALCMWRCTDGSFTDLLHSLWGNRKAVLLYLIPAGCMVTYDVLSFISLSRITTSQYQILIQLRVVLIAVMWQVVFAKRLPAKQWFLLGMCIYAVMLTQRTSLCELSFSGPTCALAPYLTVGLQLIVSMCGNLANEKLLKEVPLPINAQNAVLYGWSVIMLFGALVSGEVKKGSSTFTLAGLHTVMTPWMIASILSLSLLGIATSFLLKLCGNIWKELIGMSVTMTVVFIQWMISDTGPDVIDVQSALLLPIGMCLFALVEIGVISPEKLPGGSLITKR